MDATIGEPFILSSYSISQRLPKSAVSGKARQTPSNVYATHENGSGSSDGYVTVTVQADGVHVLDLSTLHPIISHSLGPSTTFSCPAITRSARDGAETICTTYAVLDSSSGISSDESGRTIWVWKENLSSSLADRALQKKKSIEMPHPVLELHVSEELPSQLFVLSPTCDITVMDAELNVQNTRTSPETSRVLLKSFVFSRKSCSFVPSSAPARGAIVILIAVSGDMTWLRTLAIGQEEGFIELGECQVPLKSEQIASISCSTTGYLSVMTRDASWNSFQLDLTNPASISLSHVAEPIRLACLSFISSSNYPDEISLLSLGSSHVLLAGISNTPTREITLLLWDLQYSVLLASQCFSIPPSLSQSNENSIKFSFATADASQALLVLTSTVPSAHSNSHTLTSSPSRSGVLVVPFTVPATSTIANAMGRASSGAKWFAQPNLSDSQAFPNQSNHDRARMKLLDVMRSAMEQNRPQAAKVAFFEWEKREKDASAKAEIADSESTQGGTSSYNGKSPSDSFPVLEYSFVRDLLTTILQPSRLANIPYSSEVVRYLLSRKAICGNMVEEGLLALLRLRNDWKSMEFVLTNVLDIREADIMTTLQYVIARHRQHLAAASGEADAMHIDASPTDMPLLVTFLSWCVCYPTSPVALRLAVREHLQDMDDMICVLDVLESWIAKWGTREVRLLPSKKSISKNQHGILVPKPDEKSKKGDLPPLVKVLSFLQTLLDASFLNLLQHSPSHRVLRKIFAQIQPEISFIDQMEQLRGPLEPFAKAQGKAVKEGSEGRRKEPQVDWRQRRKQTHDQAGLAVGLYRLEELVV